MKGIETEFAIFVLAVLAGIIVRLAYECIAYFRRLVKHNYIAMGIEDFLFWLGTAFYLFVQMFHTSDGSIRWYFILGVVAGVSLCSFFLRFVEKRRKKMYARKRMNLTKGIDKCSKKR